MAFLFSIQFVLFFFHFIIHIISPMESNLLLHGDIGF
jgi:hypothetical protein